MTVDDLATSADEILRECAAVPLRADDDELAAVAIAVHLEERLGRALPVDLLAPEYLVPTAARARTVRLLVGEA